VLRCSHRRAGRCIPPGQVHISGCCTNLMRLLALSRTNTNGLHSDVDVCLIVRQRQQGPDVGLRLQDRRGRWIGVAAPLIARKRRIDYISSRRRSSYRRPR
jgi:hypothetical protein